MSLTAVPTPGQRQRALERALATLDPGDRALLDLSVNRGIPEERIAALLGLGSGAIAERRTSLVDSLAAPAGLAGPEARPRIEAMLREVGDRTWLGEPAGAPRRRWGRLAPAAAVAALAAAGIAAALVTSGNGGDAAGDKRPASTGVEEEPGLAGTAMAPVPGAGASGAAAARVSEGAGNALRLDVALRLPDPPRGRLYAIWLYRSRADAVAVAAALSGTARIGNPLPPGFRRYPYVDVSVQRPSVLHGGRSLFRVRLERLLGAAAGA